MKGRAGAICCCLLLARGGVSCWNFYALKSKIPHFTVYANDLLHVVAECKPKCRQGICPGIWRCLGLAFGKDGGGKIAGLWPLER